MDWRRIYDTKPSLVREGGGFQVRIYSPDGLRYTDGTHSLTLMTESLDETEERGRRFFLLPTLVEIVYIPSALSWDDGTTIDEAEAELILRRIGLVLSKIYRHYRIAVNDEIYREARLGG